MRFWFFENFWKLTNFIKLVFIIKKIELGIRNFYHIVFRLFRNCCDPIFCIFQEKNNKIRSIMILPLFLFSPPLLHGFQFLENQEVRKLFKSRKVWESWKFWNFCWKRLSLEKLNNFQVKFGYLWFFTEIKNLRNEFCSTFSCFSLLQ